MEENKKPKLIKGKEILDKIPEDSFIKLNKDSVLNFFPDILSTEE